MLQFHPDFRAERRSCWSDSKTRTIMSAPLSGEMKQCAAGDLSANAGRPANDPRPVGCASCSRTAFAGLRHQRLLIVRRRLGRVQLAATLASNKRNTGFFAETPVCKYQQIARSYQQGSEFLFSADLEQISRGTYKLIAAATFCPGMGTCSI